MIRLLAFACLPLMLAACAGESEAPASPFTGQWIDLTHTLGEEAVFWPTAADYVHEQTDFGTTEGGWFYSSYNIALSEHGGTHLDAPIHFAEGRRTADAVPLESLIGPAAVIDVSDKAARDRDYRFTREDLAEWEEIYGEVPAGTILLFHTGFGRYWPDREKYMGTERRGPEGVANLHFPGLSAELAQFLIGERKVAAVGLDTPSLDYGPSQDFMVHRILLGADIPGFENVANLDRLPPRGAFVIALPTKIRAGSGAPLRIVAHVPPPGG